MIARTMYFDYDLFWAELSVSANLMKLTVNDICRESGVSRSAYYRLKSRSAVMPMGSFIRLCTVGHLNPARYFYYVNQATGERVQ